MFFVLLSYAECCRWCPVQVTLIAATEGELKLPEVKSAADLRNALTTLGSITSDELQVSVSCLPCNGWCSCLGQSHAARLLWCAKASHLFRPS